MRLGGLSGLISSGRLITDTQPPRETKPQMSFPQQKLTTQIDIDLKVRVYAMLPRCRKQLLSNGFVASMSGSSANSTNGDAAAGPRPKPCPLVGAESRPSRRQQESRIAPYATGFGNSRAADPLSADRQRRAGAGRRAREVEQPELIGALERLVEPVARGDPMSPLAVDLQEHVHLGRRVETSRLPGQSVEGG